ncbi:hypothetical protein [Pseudomonas citronellolis]|uniref:hypothetical protein n=1 Tax=Pseudomonas citronellolis TaxID=53408 RepID=UPI0023E433F0|nr:hypothetical protein [Pseudomonas citronellolis]MDF3935692.1 hypothetical protein [Pseudomonas citronellolis]
MRPSTRVLLAAALLAGLAGCAGQSCEPGQPGSNADRDARQQIPRQQIDPRVQSMPRY